MDLRERIAAALSAGDETHPCIAERFNVSRTSVERIARKVREGRSLEPDSPPGPESKLKQKERDWLRTQIERDPYVSSYELTGLFNKSFRRNRVHRSTILRAMHELGFSFKKNSVLPKQGST